MIYFLFICPFLPKASGILNRLTTRFHCLSLMPPGPETLTLLLNMVHIPLSTAKSKWHLWMELYCSLFSFLLFCCEFITAPWFLCCTPLRAAASLAVLLDVKLPAGFGGFQHEFIQLANLFILEFTEFPVRQVGPELHRARPHRRCRLQNLSLQDVPVVL